MKVGAAALAAAALVYGLGAVGLASLGAHVLLSDEQAGRLVPFLVLTGSLNALAAIGVFVLVLAGGDCNDSGHIPPVAWAAAAVLYLVGATSGLRGAVRDLWAVPASFLLGGLLLVGVATVLTGSTGACLE